MEGKSQTFAGHRSPRPSADTFWPKPGSEPVEWSVADRPVDYPQAVASMEDRVERIGAGTAAELIWLVEHPPLYTAGTSALEQDLVDPRFPVHRAGRGGQYTYHGPGQRVIYVMLDLRRRRQDVRAFVAALEAWIIATLAKLAIRAERRDSRVGVWVLRPDKSPGLDGTPAEDKIAAIGVRLRRWVSFHGVSLNIDPDLGHFAGIVPCGVRERQFGVTSLIDLGAPVSMPEVDALLRTQFEQVFGPTRRGSEQSKIRLVAAHDGRCMMDDRPTKIEQTDARQARTGVGVRYVLMASLALVVVALLVVFLVVR